MYPCGTLCIHVHVYVIGVSSLFQVNLFWLPMEAILLITWHHSSLITAGEAECMKSLHSYSLYTVLYPAGPLSEKSMRFPPHYLLVRGLLYIAWCEQ